MTARRHSSRLKVYVPPRLYGEGRVWLYGKSRLPYSIRLITKLYFLNPTVFKMAGP